MLQQVHLDGALTRAELTARSGLSRSTIGGLVSALADLELLCESVPPGGPRSGRPSHVVRPRADGPFVVAVDVDVSRVTTAAVGLGGRVLARHVVRTAGPVPPSAVVWHVAAAVPVLQQQVPARSRPAGIGISVPGTVERRTGTVGLAPNLGWRDVPLGELVRAAAPRDLPVSVGNDADLAVLAEHRRGSARGCDDVVYLLGRIGVGAGILVDGRPLHGAGGLAGEVGHTVLDPAGPPCHCGGRGCVETFIGDAALLRLAGEGTPAAAGPRAAREVLCAAARGDEQALGAVRRLGHDLGRVVANVVNLLNPHVVVMGGSLREVLAVAQDQVQSALDGAALVGARAQVELQAAGLGEDSSLLGAAELAFGPVLADPLSVASPAVPAAAAQ